MPPSAAPSAAVIQTFCEQVYTGVEDGWLVLSYPDPTAPKPDGTPAMKSDWFDVARTPWQALASAAARRSRTSNVYFGVVLQQPDCEPGQFKRSRSATAYSVPGLWFDLDLAYGHHAASQLPATDREALQFLADLPARPSLIVHSGGGLYGYWLFREPYVITTEDAHEAIAHCSRQFTHTIVEAGKLRGWTLDALGDLARVLRPPGTINHKYGKLVELIHEGHERYNLADFDWLEPLPEPARAQHQGTSIAGQPDLVTIAEHYGTRLERKSKAELVGMHPQHGSSTGSNFNVNLAKGLWHCWRHGTGGDALALIAVCEGVLLCEAAVSGALRGELFTRAVQVANDTFQAGISLDAERRRTGDTPGPQPSDHYACPELPAYARIDTDQATNASLFLNDYIAFSTKWAPRAYEGFHEAVALFVLATVAARRIRIEFGPRGVYTSLYMALTARTTLFTKTTAADIGLALLEQAGLDALLADDDASPQAFLRSLTRYVPTNYGDLSAEEQARLTQQMAFTAQRGWFYEEWGQHLEAMMQRHGFMASFRGILRRLDDHKARYVYTTISRGSDVLYKPYLTLLANVTPADLQPFVRAGSALWRDGYIARMAFVTPDTGDGGENEFTEGPMTFPQYFATTLTAWHKRLGIPWCRIEPTSDDNGKSKGAPAYKVTSGVLTEKVYTLSPQVREAYYKYDKALRELTRQRQSEDLDGSYGRFPMKALRIAGLLASLHDDNGSYTIWPSQWARGQQIAEHWRRDLHRLRAQVREPERPSRQAIREETVLRVLREKGAQSLPWLQSWTKWPYTELSALCEGLVSVHVLTRDETSKTVKYGVNGIAP